MLSIDFGRQIKARRADSGLGQEALCKRAGVSRAVLSRLENERGSPVQTDVLDRLLEALGTVAHVQVGEQETPRSGRVEERLRQQLRQEALRQRHLRVALDLLADPRGARARIRRALEQVSLWESRRSCSPRYIERWRMALNHDAKGVAVAMTSFGDWENAMFQNTPWSFLWT